MNNYLLVYFQFNLLLALSYVLWVATNSFNLLSKNSIPFKLQLKIARTLLLFLFFLTLLSPQITKYFPNTINTDLNIPLVDAFQMQQLISSSESIIVSPVESALAYSAGITDLLLLGFLIQLTRFGLCFSRLYKIISHATPWRKVGTIKMLFSEKISSPFSTRAFFQSHIILPYSLLNSPENLRIAIRHEVQHHRNRDLNWILLVEALKLFCFWNPAAYLWKNRIDCLQEYACDEALLSGKKTSQVEYSKCLLDIATYQDRCTLIACSNMVPNFSFFKKSDSQLKRRLTMLDTIKTTQKSSFKTFTQAALLCLGVITSSVFVYAQGEESKGITINGIFIPEQEYQPDGLEEMPEDNKKRYIEIMDLAFDMLSHVNNEPSDAQTLRVIKAYMRSQMIVRGLEDYATGYEMAYDDLEKEKISLEAKIAKLELENTRLLNQN